VMTGLLRGRLGYRGVVVSDDLDMRAIADHVGAGAAAVAAIRAGWDVLLLCKSEDHQAEAEAALIPEAGAGGGLRRPIGAGGGRGGVGAGPAGRGARAPPPAGGGGGRRRPSSPGAAPRGAARGAGREGKEPARRDAGGGDGPGSAGPAASRREIVPFRSTAR